MYLKPEGKSGYSIYPDKDDLNRFFTTLKQSLDNIDKVRGELAKKYYALAENKPELKVDLFHTSDERIRPEPQSSVWPCSRPRTVRYSALPP